MPKSYLVTAVEFSGDQRPVRSGLYVRRHKQGYLVWSYFTERTKIWGSSGYFNDQGGAYRGRNFPSAAQRFKWYALPQQIPSGARVERVSGLTFRVTEA